MDNSEFDYFLHGTSVDDPNLIDDIFNNGLLNFRENDMLSTMWPVKINEGELGSKVKEYSGTKGNAVFVIKIPKYYLKPSVVNGQLRQIPLPIWKTVLDKYGKRISQLSPELVYGVYLSENESFLQNPNYSPIHNPSGLKFDNQQIEYFLNNELYNWHSFAVDRKEKTFEELQQMDTLNKHWDDAVQQYSQHFGIEQSTHHKL